jgi:hypothetical protein
MLLHLKDHCIETAAKRERRRVVSELLEVEESSERFGQLAADLEVITEFLEDSDFRKMRSERPELSGGCDIHVELRRDAGSGGVEVRVVGSPQASSS